MNRFLDILYYMSLMNRSITYIEYGDNHIAVVSIAKDHSYHSHTVYDKRGRVHSMHGHMKT